MKTRVCRKQPTEDFLHDSSGPPLDYSFMEIKDLSEIIDEDPYNGTRKRKPSVDAVQADKEDQAPQLAVPPPDADEPPLYRTTAIRLASNQLTTLQGLPKALAAVMDDAALYLTWIDFSFNQLSEIDQVLSSFPELRVLYLHFNHIARLHEVKRLAHLHHLHSLTLHGNPLEQVKHYRLYVLSILPQLRSLDFASVTPHDRVKATQWHTVHVAPKLRANASTNKLT